MWKRPFRTLTAGGALPSLKAMTHFKQRLRLLIPAVILAVWMSTAHAGDFVSTTPSVFGFTPKVPVSALARPAGWFDPSRLHLSTSVTMGSGFGGGAEGLQVTSLRYQFQAPVWMNVNVGNAWVRMIGNPRFMRACVQYGFPRRRLMDFALRMMANLTDGRNGDSQDRLMHALVSMAPQR